MIRVLVVWGAFAASACQTFGDDNVEITTEPPGALVRIEGFGECDSPCTVEVDKPRQVTIAKAGYEAEKLSIEPGKDVNLKMKLVAPTKNVDASEMPDIQ